MPVLGCRIDVPLAGGIHLAESTCAYANSMSPTSTYAPAQASSTSLASPSPQERPPVLLWPSLRASMLLRRGGHDLRSAARRDGDRSASMRWWHSRARVPHHCQLQSAGQEHWGPWCTLPPPSPPSSAPWPVAPEDSLVPLCPGCPLPPPRVTPETSSRSPFDTGVEQACPATCSSSLASNKYCTRAKHTMHDVEQNGPEQAPKEWWCQPTGPVAAVPLPATRILAPGRDVSSTNGYQRTFKVRGQRQETNTRVKKCPSVLHHESTIGTPKQ